MADAIGLIPRRVAWTTQPPKGTPINWAHPLATGLTYVKNFAGMNGPDAAKNVSPSIVDHVQQAGFMAATGTSGDYFDSNYAPLVHSTTTPKCSFVVICRTIDGGGTFVSCRDGGDVVFQFYSAAPNLNARIGDQIVTLDAATGSFDGAWHALGYSQENGVDYTAWVDGVIGSAGPQAHTGTESTSAINLSIGNRWQTYPTTGYEMDGDFKAFFFWHGRKLTTAEHLQIANNPWQLFQPRTIWLPVGIAAVAAGSIMNQLQGSNLGSDLYNGTIL